MFDERLDGADGGAAQAKRVLRAGGSQSRREQADQGVKPVGQCHDQTFLRLGDGLILFGNASGDFL